MRDGRTDLDELGLANHQAGTCTAETNRSSAAAKRRGHREHRISPCLRVAVASLTWLRRSLKTIHAACQRANSVGQDEIGR